MTLMHNSACVIDGFKKSSVNGSVEDSECLPINGLSVKRPANLNFENIQEPGSSIPNSYPQGEASASVKKHDLGFSNLSYTVKTGILRRENKTILNGIHGNFQAGHLTAIMGPSGAGKSSLLNILSGYITQNFTGEITVNGNPRNIKRFLHQSALIMQDHDLQPHLTVIEAMHFSANLKIGNAMCPSSKKERITQILEAIAMNDSRKTKSCNLSGGQKKRLSIALELVSNPPVMLLDEPTSGLDSSTSKQCVSLLKDLAKEGRTIICTIHQPSALLFEMFDHLFALAEGQCIYSGGTGNVVPFLADLNLKCPEHYNPSDYLLEISTNDYGCENPNLVQKIKNGQYDLYRKTKRSTAEIAAMDKVEQMMETGLITPVKAPIFIENTRSPLTPIKEMSSSFWNSNGIIGSALFPIKEKNSSPSKDCKLNLQKIKLSPGKCCNQGDRYASSFWFQLSYLLRRTFLILYRNKSLTTTRFIIHAVMAGIVGILYFGIGNDASNILNNFRYIFFSIMFLMFTAFSSTTLNFPCEFPVVAREHFNRWYSLRAYYVAITLADIPIQLICTFIFIAISYLLTNQPLEIYRASLFFAMCLMASLVAQSIGLVVGATFDVKNGAILGPFFISPFLIFSGFFVQMRDVHEVLHWLFHMSFLKHALQGASLAIFGYGRPKMECNEIFCMYIRPQRFLKAVDMADASYLSGTIALIFIFFLLRFIAFFIMSYRLRLKR